MTNIISNRFKPGGKLIPAQERTSFPLTPDEVSLKSDIISVEKKKLKAKKNYRRLYAPRKDFLTGISAKLLLVKVCIYLSG